MLDHARRAWSCLMMHTGFYICFSLMNLTLLARCPHLQYYCAPALGLELPQTSYILDAASWEYQSFGHSLPTTCLPCYSAGAVGLSQNTGTMLVSLFNATSIFGGIALGDVMLLSSVGSALSVLLFWEWHHLRAQARIRTRRELLPYLLSSPLHIASLQVDSAPLGQGSSLR